MAVNVLRPADDPLWPETCQRLRRFAGGAEGDPRCEALHGEPGLDVFEQALFAPKEVC